MGINKQDLTIHEIPLSHWTHGEKDKKNESETKDQD